MSKSALLLPLKSLEYKILFYFLVLVKWFNNYAVALTSFILLLVCVSKGIPGPVGKSGPKGRHVIQSFLLHH